MSASYILSRFTDRYGKGYYVVVKGRDAGMVRKTTASGPFKWEATTMDGTRVCTGRTQREVAETVAARVKS